MMQKQPEHHGRRDGETMIVLGIFMFVMAVPVLIGTIWAGPPFDKVVNFFCGLAILLIGVAFFFRGKVLLRRNSS